MRQATSVQRDRRATSIQRDRRATSIWQGAHLFLMSILFTYTHKPGHETADDTNDNIPTYHYHYKNPKPQTRAFMLNFGGSAPSSCKSYYIYYIIFNYIKKTRHTRATGAGFPWVTPSRPIPVPAKPIPGYPCHALSKLAANTYPTRKPVTNNKWSLHISVLYLLGPSMFIYLHKYRVILDKETLLFD